MTTDTDTIEQNVLKQIQQMQQQGRVPVAVMLGHEDWLIFAEQSEGPIRLLAVPAVINPLWVVYCWFVWMK